jgi:hypothetical protein
MVSTWTGDYEVDPAGADIRPASEGTRPVDIEFGLVILFYLLGSQDVPLANEWVSEKDLPGGVTFFRGPHSIPANLITDQVKNDIQGLEKTCERLGGEKLDMADASYRIRVVPRVPVAVLYWAGDDEFDPQCKVLFDRTVSQHLPLDVIFGLSVDLCREIRTAYNTT